jgi:alpha-tubulin suppressor-like RCC1 family protein
MINSQNLINKICARIDCGGLTELQTCQTTGALNLLSNPVVSVSSFANLPNASEYAGRLIYVDDENRYYHAVDGYWLDKLNGEIINYADAIWSWGRNDSGELGDNTAVSKSSPVLVSGGFADWCRVNAGYQHVAGIRTNGTLWTWGNNFSGQLGDNTRVSTSSPVSVVGGFTDWCQASGGRCHTLGLRQNGTIWAWGANTAGRLGDNTTVSKSSPVSVVGEFSDWCQVSAGLDHSLAVRQNGSIWSWGCNGNGRLGDNTSVDKSSPVSVVGGFTDWCQASAGRAHSVAIRNNGTLWSWGYNAGGQLGIGTSGTSLTSPVSVVGGFTDWYHASAGNDHNLAVRTTGTLWAWGCNGSGRLGNNTTVASNSPVSVVGGFTDWCQASAGNAHSLGIRQNGTLWAWGCNGNGRLGDNTCIVRSSPVSVVGGFTDWCHASAGGLASLAVRQVCKGI